MPTYQELCPCQVRAVVRSGWHPCFQSWYSFAVLLQSPYTLTLVYTGVFGIRESKAVQLVSLTTSTSGFSQPESLLVQ